MAKAAKAVIEAAGLSIPIPTMMNLDEIQMARYNPRTFTKEKMASLKASLLRNGLVLNLVVQKKNNVLIGGHQRIKAIREICEEKGWEVPKEVPTIVLDVDDARAKQLNVALNKIDGDFDPYKLGEVFKDMRHDMTLDDILATGFKPEEIDETIKLVMNVDNEQEQEPHIGSFASAITLSVQFKTAKDRDEAKGILNEVKEAGQDPGRVLLRAMRAAKLSGGIKSADGRKRKSA